MDKSKYYNKAIELRATGNYGDGIGGKVRAFEDFYKQKPDCRWPDFLAGWDNAIKDESSEMEKKYHVDEFKAELTALCQKYEISLYTKDGGCMVRNYEFDVDISSIIKL
jgi:hypothetical protein